MTAQFSSASLGGRAQVRQRDHARAALQARAGEVAHVGLQAPLAQRVQHGLLVDHAVAREVEQDEPAPGERRGAGRRRGRGYASISGTCSVTKSLAFSTSSMEAALRTATGRLQAASTVISGS